jgi:hypothetical protein
VGEDRKEIGRKYKRGIGIKRKKRE